MELKGLIFSKLHGASNSFIFLDLRAPKKLDTFRRRFGKKMRARLARNICNPNTGIGADGFAIFERSTRPGIDIIWDFYNADGSKAEMCGNAARCAGLYLSRSRPKSSAAKPFVLLTGSGPVRIQFANQDKIFVQMSKIKNWKEKQKIFVGGKTFTYSFVNSGVPHVVLATKKVPLNDGGRELARKIQNSPKFQPRSTNVSFYSVSSPGNIKSATFERGVFDFTKACGTGAVAAAYDYHKKNPDYRRIKVNVPGGQLIVDFNEDRPILIGPARAIADFIYKI